MPTTKIYAFAAKEDSGCPTFTVEDDVLVCGADVGIKVQTVSFI